MLFRSDETGCGANKQWRLTGLRAAVGGLWGNHIAIQEGGAIPIAHFKSCISQPDYDRAYLSQTMTMTSAVTRSIRNTLRECEVTGPNPRSVAPRLRLCVDGALD